MNETKSKKPTLVGNDIIFECPQCGKNLAIDCRGAGLNIHCPQCDHELEVPIPEGFDLAELDKEITTIETLDENMETATPVPHAAAEAAVPGPAGQINKLKAEIEGLRVQRQYLVQQHADLLKTIKALSRQAEEFHQALSELSLMLDALTGPEADETQRLA